MNGAVLGQVNDPKVEVPLLRVLGDGEGVAGVEPPKLSPETSKKAFRTMLLVRTLDVKLTNMQRQGRIGFYGACTGQEATPIGTAMALRPELSSQLYSSIFACAVAAAAYWLRQRGRGRILTA